VNSKVSSAVGKLYLVKRIISFEVNIILLKAYLLSAYDSCFDIWAIHSRNDLTALQNKINGYLYDSMHPTIFRKLQRMYRKSNRHKRKIRYFKWHEFDMYSIFKYCKLAPIIDRANWTRAKNVLKYLRSPVQDLNIFANCYCFTSLLTFSRSFSSAEISYQGF